MATVHLSPVGNGFQFFGTNGLPLVGGLLYTYQTNSATPAATYTTSVGNVANANPIVLSADGRLASEVWLIEGTAYRFQLKTALGTLIQTLDDLYGINDLSVNAGPLPSTSVTFLQAGSGAVARTMQTKVREVEVSVTDFNCPVDGTTSAVAAIVRAITAISATGGTVVFPSHNGERYMIDSEISVSSVNPIHLRSDMLGAHYDPTLDSAIIVGASFAGFLFKYTAPNPALRGAHGGGSVKGLAFIDPTGSGAVQGTRAINGCIYAQDFNQSDIDIQAYWILGSAIKTEYCVRSDIKAEALWCGAAAKPAVWVASNVDAVHVTQGTRFILNQETCYSAPYVQEDANSAQNKFFGCVYEAETAIAASNQPFFKSYGTLPQLVGCHFNRNTGVQLDIQATATNPLLTGCVFNTSGPTISTACQSVAFTGCTFYGTYTGKQVEFTAGYGQVSGSKFLGCGNIVLGTNSIFGSNEVRSLSSTQNYAIEADTGTVVSGNKITNNAKGGVRLVGIKPICIGNEIHDNTTNGIRNETGDSIIVGNQVYNNTAADYSFTAYPSTYNALSNSGVTGAKPLTFTYNVAPGIIAAGGVFVYNPAGLAGVAFGDWAIVSGPNIAGLMTSVYVLGANLIEMTIFNPTGAPINAGGPYAINFVVFKA